MDEVADTDQKSDFRYATPCIMPSSVVRWHPKLIIIIFARECLCMFLDITIFAHDTDAVIPVCQRNQTICS